MNTIKKRFREDWIIANDVQTFLDKVQEFAQKWKVDLEDIEIYSEDSINISCSTPETEEDRKRDEEQKQKSLEWKRKRYEELKKEFGD